MKALYKIAIMMSAVILAACTAGQQDDIFNIPLDGYTLFETDFEEVDLEGSAGLFWDKGQSLGVFGSAEGKNEKYTLKRAFDGKAVGEFYGPKVSGDMISAYYPYSDDFSLFEGMLHYTLVNLQEYDGTETLYQQFGKYSKVVYAFNDNDGKLKFGYASGVLLIEPRLNLSASVKSVSVSSEDVLAGLGGVDRDMSVKMSIDGMKTITLDCGEGLPMKNGDAYNRLPVVLPVGTYRGVKVALTLSDDSVIESEYDSIEIKRVTASDCPITEVVVTAGLGGFDVEDNLEFEQ